MSNPEEAPSCGYNPFTSDKSRPLPNAKALAKRALARKKGRALMSESFLDDNPMDDSYPGCSLANFKKPHLRKCPHDLDSATFTGHVSSNPESPYIYPERDGGLDGYNWKIRFEKSGPTFVLKLLWDAEPPQPPHYFAAQRECHNAALFQMMQAAVSEDKAELGAILVNASPESKNVAAANLFAFSDEGRAKNATLESTENMVEIKKIPRMRRCYGWMRFTGEELLPRLAKRRLEPPLIRVSGMKRAIEKDKTYTALVYEFVEQGVNDPAVTQEVLDFFWRVGFAHVPVTKAENWASGVLLDHSDIVHCKGQGWDSRFFGYRTTEEILRDPAV